VKLADLKITEGVLPRKPAQYEWRFWQRLATMRPYAILDGKGVVYVSADETTSMRLYGTPPAVTAAHTENRDAILVRTSLTGDVSGRLYLPKPDGSGMAILKFSIPASAADAKAKTAFYQAKEDHYNRLLAASIPGGAWFRHEVRQAQAALYKTPQGVSAETRRPMWDPNSPHNSELVETYALFSGGRALSENLQLDRSVQGTKPEEETIDVDTIDGITVPEIDWKPLVKDLKPKLDPLAASIPANQHVIFFPTFSSMVRASDEEKLQGTPILQLAEPRSEDARTVERYQRQLGLSLTGLAGCSVPRWRRALL
jgi:hypothetical protein